MLKSHNIGHFDQRLTFETNTRTNQDGSWADSWSATYSDVPAKELRARVSDGFDGEEQVDKHKREWLVRLFDHTYLPGMRVTDDSSTYYYVIGVRTYKGDRRTRVVEAEYRGNV